MIRKILAATALLVVCNLGRAQAPEAFNYQAVVRDITGSIISSQNIGIQISILQGSISGAPVYVETHNLTTNSYGLISTQIGTGVVQFGSMSSIGWGSALFFVKIEIDPAGGTNYQISSASQLVSVPYALYAEQAGNSFSGDYNDLINVPTDVSTFNNDVGYIATEVDGDPSNELQNITLVGNNLTLSNGGGTVVLPTSLDNDPANEYNTNFSLSGNNLNITDGGGTLTVDLTPFAGGVDQTLSMAGNNLTISGVGGNTVGIDGDPTNEYNTNVTLTGNNLNIIDGGGTVTVDLSPIAGGGVDQTLSIAGNNLTISGVGGNTVGIDTDPTNEYLTGANLSGTTLNIIDAGGTQSVDLSSLVGGGDPSSTNELNTNMTLVGTMLSVVDPGGSVSIDLAPIAGGSGDPDQSLSVVGNNLTISGSGGNTVGIDTDPTNEYLTGANLTGTTLNIIDGGGTQSVDLSSLVGGGDPSSTNELNTGVTLVGTTLNVTDPGGTLSVDLSSLSGGGGGFRVGQVHQGGIIIYVDSSGTGGLIAATADLPGNFAWQDGTTGEVVGAQSLTDGTANTAAIVAFMSNAAVCAAEACDSHAGGGFNDWYLPSVYELQLMFQASYVLGNIQPANVYWSSSDRPGTIGTQAWEQDFTGFKTSQNKNTARKVRPIRQF